MEKPGAPIFNFFRRLFGFYQQPPPPTVPIAGGSVSQRDIIETTYSKDNPTLLQQIREAQKYRRFIEEAANQYGFLPAVVCGIGSRESQWGLALTPPDPSGRGDFARRPPRGERRTPEPPDGPGYGRGLMQIDYDWHEFARTGNWQSPKENISYACSLLAQFRQDFKTKGVPKDLLLRVTLAAYNAGPTTIWNAYREGHDVDVYTTGKDYSQDVLSRSGWFQLHGWR